MKLILIIYFILPSISKILSFLHVINIKIIILHIPFHIRSSKPTVYSIFRVCILYLLRQVFSSHMWAVATILDSIDLDSS